MTSARWIFVGLSASVLVLILAACSGDQNGDSNTGGNGDYGQVGGGGIREPEQDGRRCPRDENLVEESFDTSGDNVADVRKLYRIEGEGDDRHRTIVCRELDLNHDGRKDIFRFYTEDGRPMRELADTDFDGSIDSISFYEEGRLVRQELDRNQDTRPDETRHFVREELVRVERDESGDNVVDVWEHWNEGALLRIGYDTNGDQVADFWHRAPPREDEDAEIPEPTSPGEDSEEGGAEQG